jgi:hypothetical protein
MSESLAAQSQEMSTAAIQLAQASEDLVTFFTTDLANAERDECSSVVDFPKGRDA